MGHTVPSQRQVIEEIVSAIDTFKEDLSEREASIVDAFVEDIYRHANSASYANTYHTWAVCLLSVLLEREKAAQGWRHDIQREEQPLTDVVED
jgi:hypothetical protein